jgi:hypothetical protein
MQQTRRHNMSMDELPPDDDSGDDGHDGLSLYNNPLRVQQAGQGSGAVRLVVIVLLVIAVAFVVIDSLGDRRIESAILHFLEWVEEHPHEGVLAVICVYIIATILFVPGSILTFGTGYAFGSAYDNKLEGVLVASMVSVGSHPSPSSVSANILNSNDTPESSGGLRWGLFRVDLHFSFGEVSFSELCRAVGIVIPNFPSY